MGRWGHLGSGQASGKGAVLEAVGHPKELYLPHAYMFTWGFHFSIRPPTTLLPRGWGAAPMAWRFGEVDFFPYWGKGR